MYFEHPYPANTGCEMALGFAPGGESGGIQVCVSVFGEQAIQRLKDMRRGIKLPPQRSFHSHIPMEDRGESG
jgi:hypothetical protein